MEKYTFSKCIICNFRCFYFAMKTSMSIGKNAKPGIDNSSEMIFMTGILLLSYMYTIIDLDLPNCQCPKKKGFLNKQFR